MNEEDAGKYGIEDLQRKLYSQEGGNFKVRRSVLSPNYKNISKTWLDDALNNPAPKKSSWLSKLFIFSIIFFVVAIALGSYLFLQNSSVISNQNIDLSVKGPAEIKAGDRVDLQISIVNKNKVPIDSVELLSEYATGTRAVGNINTPLLHASQDLGQINPGGVTNQTISALIFGKENETKAVKLTLKYRITGSNNFFEKETIYNIKISASPIDLTVDIPSNINSGQDMTIKITAMDNSPAPLENILLGFDYPPGFTFKSADLKPSYGDNRWLLGDMQSGVVRTITITGTMTGKPAELKSFHLVTGVPDSAATQNIGISYNNQFKVVTMTKPPLDIALDEDASNMTANGNSSRTFRLGWTNNLADPLSDGQVSISVVGDVVDRENVRVINGYFSSYNNTVSWDKNTDPALGSMDPGSSGDLSFTIGTLPLVRSEDSSLKNPAIKLHIVIKGTKASAGLDHQTVETDVDSIVKVNSFVEPMAEAVHSTGPFTNSGPLPPQAEKDTAYTINWAVNNSSNDVQNAAMEAVLAPNVTWTNQTAPKSEDLIYIAKDNKVVWNVGHLSAGAGISGPPRQVSFQVSLRPSTSDIGQVPNLTAPFSFSGADTFTGTKIDITGNRALDTTLSNDPQFRYDQAKVVP